MNRTNKMQQTLGQPSQHTQKKIHGFLDEVAQAFIANSPFLVLASSNKAGDCDASPKGGAPGWVKVVDKNTLLIPDLGGNRLFQSYGNMSENPKAGLVFLIPGQDITLRVNGHIRIVEKEQLESRGLTVQVIREDSNAVFVQGILLKVEQVYFHCPRAFYFAELWNFNSIEKNKFLKFKA
ncbi:MAG: hypothetical protein COC19_04960 [SAR86 cluster bacterium]|uniref:Pyridoxamine 5'-phosphate oxidase N-terminal domain-containing protein n=1 Tax=SAR86 cluster bacterium TaxID=2030880 RepID=A0A2A4MNP5_9GAMM|nr:MAG: hypothetical protein COC19_04960 [SAR86 cluster bacterium]